MQDFDLIRLGAPTLAGIKTASLFTCSFQSKEELCRQIRQYNQKLNSFGVYLTVLLFCKQYALLYLYSKESLKKDLARPAARELADLYGYPVDSVIDSLAFLQKRLHASDTFPHEIGLFLGYPIEDVRRFIFNNGKNCLYSDLWKVYGNVAERRKTFALYHKCVRVYQNCYRAGRSIAQMTVRQTAAS